MLRLEACLVGKAADTLEDLHYSEMDYETAKLRLQRKFCGERRQIQHQMEKLRNMRALQLDNVEDLGKFTDVLENTVVMLQNQGYVHELQPNNTLYTMMLRSCYLNITAGS